MSELMPDAAPEPPPEMPAVLAPAPGPAAPARTVLEAVAVSKYFDVSKPWLQRVLAGQKRQVLRAVDEVSFAIPLGGTLSLVGESGCGKSTVARLAVGLYAPTRGEMRFEGQPLSAARAQPALRRRMNMVFQDPYASLNPRWRVRDIVAEPIRAFGLLRSPGGSSIAVPPASIPRWCQASTSSGVSKPKPMVDPLPWVAGPPSIGFETMNTLPLRP